MMSSLVTRQWSQYQKNSDRRKSTRITLTVEAVAVVQIYGAHICDLLAHIEDVIEFENVPANKTVVDLQATRRAPRDDVVASGYKPGGADEQSRDLLPETPNPLNSIVPDALRKKDDTVSFSICVPQQRGSQTTAQDDKM
jgi:hypothetical protein